MAQYLNVFVFGLLCLLPSSVLAQQAGGSQPETAAASQPDAGDPSAKASSDQDLSDLAKQLAQALELLQAQQKTLEEQKTLLTQQGQRIDRLQAELDDIQNPVSVIPDKPADRPSDGSTDIVAAPATPPAAADAQVAAAPQPDSQTTTAAAVPAEQTAGATEQEGAEVAAAVSDASQPSTADAVVDSSDTTPSDREVAVTEEAQGAQEDDPTRDILASLPGAMRLPGTNAVMRIGGYVKTDYVQSFDPLSIDNRFVTGAIPVSPQQEAGIEAQNVITVEQSRLNLDLREPTDVGLVRAFIEGDFAGSDNTFRLRHAFGQRGNVLAGKTWSGFVDRTASPEEIDFEGLNARVNVRQAQVRVQPGIGKKYELILSVEDPNPEVTNGTGVSRMPDFVVSGRVNWGGRVHARLALLLHQVRAKWDGLDDNTEKKWGYGASFSGRADLPWLDPRDNLLFQLNAGTGFGRYINDLNSVGDFDGVFSATGEMKLIDVVAGYVAFQHWWAATMRSTATLGFVHLNNPDFVAPDFYKNTWRSSMNLIWSPTPRVEVGAELLWGRRENENGEQGDASQLQVAAKYLF